jgi:MFS family permease
MEEMTQFKFSWDQAKQIFKKRTMWFVFLQGFVGVFPWNVITYFFFDYLMKERGYDEGAVLVTMAPLVLIMAAGYFVGGSLGDWAFQRTRKGRLMVASGGVITGAVFLLAAMNTSVESTALFFFFMAITALVMPFASPNIIATVYDVIVPEVRATAQSVEYFIENSGAAFAPILAGIISDAFNMGTAILWVSVIAWGLGFLFFIGAMRFINHDAQELRDQMAKRATVDKQSQIA